MKAHILPFLIFLFILSFLLLFPMTELLAEARLQRLHPASSTADFSLRSKVLTTDGSLKELSGSVLLDPGQIQNARFELRTDVSNISFGSLPLDQSFIFQGLLKSIPDPKIEFESTSLQRLQDGKYSVMGIVRSRGKTEKITFPLEVLEATASTSRFRGQVSKSYDSESSPQAALLGGVACRGNFLLEFGG